MKKEEEALNNIESVNPEIVVEDLSDYDTDHYELDVSVPEDDE